MACLETAAESVTEDDGAGDLVDTQPNGLERLAKEKQDMEAEYGRQMSRAKEFILSLDNNLKREQQLSLRVEEENRKLREKMDRVTAEAEGIRTAANFQQAASQEEIATLRRQFEEEIASMKHIVEVAASDSKRDFMAKLQAERNSWIQNKQQLESEIANLRGQINFVQQRNFSDYHHLSGVQRPSAAGGWQQGAVDLRRSGQSTPEPQTSQQQSPRQEASLEESMRWAQHNTEFMRSIVEPLEEEISILKAKLREVQEKSDISEAELASLRADSTPELGLSISESERASCEPDEKIKELEKGLNVEKSSRTDLEMYVAVLNTQKDVLQKDMEKVKDELHHVCRQLENEKASHDSLKQTWQMANVQFLETQQQHRLEMKKVADLLTSEQLDQLGNLKAVVEDIRESSVNSPEVESVLQLQDGNMLNVRPLVAPLTSPTISQSPVAGVGAPVERESIQAAATSLASQLERDKSSVGGSGSDLIQLDSRECKQQMDHLLDVGETLLSLASGGMNTSCLDKSLVINVPHHHDQTDSQATVVKSQSTSDLLADVTELGTALRSISVDSIPHLSDGSLVGNSHKSPGRTRHIVSVPLPAENSTKTITVTENEWSSLNDEVKEANNKLEQQQLLTLNYEDQLQKLQKDHTVLCRASREATTQLRHEVHKLKAQLQREQQLRSQLERSTAGASQELQTRVTMHYDEHHALKLHVTDLQETLNIMKKETDTQLATLGDNKAQLCAEIESRHSQIDALHKKLESTQQEMERTTVAERKSRTTATTALAAAEVELEQLRKKVKDTEEQLNSENMFLRDQVTSEQFAKTTMEESLQGELTTAKNEITVLKHARNELEKEKEQREKLQNELQQLDQSLRSMKGKSKETILALQSELEEERKSRIKLEQDSRQHRAQLDNLKSQLETSQSVQRDFVQLSQTLQMQLNQLQESKN